MQAGFSGKQALRAVERADGLLGSSVCKRETRRQGRPGSPRPPHRAGEPCRSSRARTAHQGGPASLRRPGPVPPPCSVTGWERAGRGMTGAGKLKMALTAGGCPLSPLPAAGPGGGEGRTSLAATVIFTLLTRTLSSDQDMEVLPRGHGLCCFVLISWRQPHSDGSRAPRGPRHIFCLLPCGTLSPGSAQQGLRVLSSHASTSRGTWCSTYILGSSSDLTCHLI